MLVDPAPLHMISELRLPGHPDPVREILDLLREDAQAMVAELERAWDADDRDGARRAAHRLKGAAVSVGAVGLAEALTGIETAAVTGRHPELRQRLDALPALVARTLAALDAIQPP